MLPAEPRTEADMSLSYRPSDATRERVLELIDREKTTGLSGEEKSELDHYMELEHIMRLAKARARASENQGRRPIRSSGRVEETKVND